MVCGRKSLQSSWQNASAYSDDFEGCFGTNSTSEIEDRDIVLHVNAAGELFKSTVALKSPSAVLSHN